MDTDALFSADDLAEMRAYSEGSLPHRARVEERLETEGPGGVTRPGAWTPRAGLEAVPCRYAPTTAEEVQTGGGVRERSTGTVVFKIGTEIRDADRLVVDGITAGIPWTRTFAIVGPLSPRSYEVMLKVGVVDYQGP